MWRPLGLKTMWRPLGFKNNVEISWFWKQCGDLVILKAIWRPLGFEINVEPLEFAHNVESFLHCLISSKNCFFLTLNWYLSFLIFVENFMEDHITLKT